MMDALTIPRGVTRHEYGRARGWLVRVYRTEQGSQKCARRLFSDGVYGGDLPALEAAVRWQSEQQENVPPRDKKRAPGHGYVQRGTRSYRTVSGELRSYDAFVAWFWDAEGRPNSTSYGIEANGAEQAEALCRDWLERERRELGEPESERRGHELAQAV